MSEADILQPHREALLERVQVESKVLLVQDTTTQLHESAGGDARVGAVAGPCEQFPGASGWKSAGMVIRYTRKETAKRGAVAKYLEKPV